MRSFIALEMPDSVKEHARGLMRELKASGTDVKWVRPENLHLTLKFLGEVDPEMVPALIDALEGARQKRSALDLAVNGCGAFPKPSQPRVVWMGLAGDIAPLAELAVGIDRAMEPLGFEPEKRGFKPHLTLGRLRRAKKGRKGPPTAPLTRALAGLAGHGGPDFRADRVTLMKSTLTPSGAIYDPIHQITLA